MAETEEDRKQAHTTCYDKLFPYASQIVSQIAANSGLAGLMLKKVEMKTLTPIYNLNMFVTLEAGYLGISCSEKDGRHLWTSCLNVQKGYIKFPNLFFM
jgi:hypothetical protein